MAPSLFTRGADKTNPRDNERLLSTNEFERRRDGRQVVRCAGRRKRTHKHGGVALPAAYSDRAVKFP